VAEDGPAEKDTGDPDTARDTWQTLDLALRIGELLISSGAGAADARSQMTNVAVACGLRRVSADVTFTEVALSHQASPDEPALLQVRQVQQREIDYADLTEVDHLVRDLIRGEIDRDEARARLNRITSTGHLRPRWSVTVGYGVMGAGVGLMLRGRPIVVGVAFVAAVGIDRIQRRLSRSRLPFFYQQVAGGLFATLLAVAVAALGLTSDPSRVVTASIILLLAGVSFMGAIQDALTGYPLTAGARILEAMLATAGIIAGVSGGLTIARMSGVDVGRLHPGSAAISGLGLLALGGAITAASFAFSSYAPVRSLLPIAVVGAAASTTYGAMYRHDFGIAWSSATAAVLVGLVSYGVAARIRVPTLAIVVSAIVPLLPGLSIYRGLSLLGAPGDPAAGLVSLINAAAIAIALSAGVILGEYVAQPVGREARRLERRLAGPRLVGPHTARGRRRRRASAEG
jgi:uncharacterized membrane protein YjjP (DUF1212 family)